MNASCGYLLLQCSVPAHILQRWGSAGAGGGGGPLASSEGAAAGWEGEGQADGRALDLEEPAFRCNKDSNILVIEGNQEIAFY